MSPSVAVKENSAQMASIWFVGLQIAPLVVTHFLVWNCARNTALDRSLLVAQLAVINYT